MNTASERDLSDSGTWATFFLSGEMFAVPVEHVQEVLMDQPLTPVPLAPRHIRGLLNLRGQIMPAIDLRRRLDFPPRADDASGSILVVKTSTQLISMLVDQATSCRYPPKTGDRRRTPCLRSTARSCLGSARSKSTSYWASGWIYWRARTMRSTPREAFNERSGCR